MTNAMDPRTELIGLLEDRARLLERQATDREDRAAAAYGFGSSAYISSLDTAESYRVEARALRAEARQLRLTG